MGLPNCLRSRFVATSVAPWAMPTAWAPIPAGCARTSSSPAPAADLAHRFASNRASAKQLGSGRAADAHLVLNARLVKPGVPFST
jgi:hypothetical protein